VTHYALQREKEKNKLLIYFFVQNVIWIILNKIAIKNRLLFWLLMIYPRVDKLTKRLKAAYSNAFRSIDDTAK